jgi:molybdopterin/thiamine biosynthesis adenylyltransferase
MTTDYFEYPIREETFCRPFRRSRWDEEPTDRLALLSERDQRAFEEAIVLLVGLGAQSFVGQGLLRSGLKRLLGCDPDHFTMSNFSRQLGYSADRGKPKAHRVFHNLKREAVNGAELTAIALPFPEALDYITEKPTVISCLVDDNQCRLAISQYARRERIPAIIAGLSNDGVRSYAFLQSADPPGPCLGCLFANIPPIRAACVAASIKTVFGVAADILHFIDVAIMGWPRDAEPHNLRLQDLHGRIEGSKIVERDPDCRFCGEA